jgi:hypothetical protein
VDAFVVGLGGDSRIYVDDTQTLRIGPSRSISYSSAALKCPWLVDELEHVLSEEPDPRVQRPLGDAFTLGRPPLSVDLSRSERSVLDALADGAHTEFELQRLTGLVTLPLVLHALEREGAVKRISMTPTDVWHVTGQFRAGSVRAAELALQMTAQSLGLTVQEAPDVLSRALRRHMDIAVTQGSSQTDLPCLVIGGPASTWWGSSRGSELIEHEVPIHAEVANAVGAAVAHAMESVDVLIRMDTISGRYLVFSPDGRQTSETLDSATHAAVRSGRAFLARVLGMDTVSADVRTADTEISSVGRGENAFVERVVSVTASWQI